MSFFMTFFCSKILGRKNPVSQAFEDLCQVLALIIQREFISATVRSQRHFPGDKHRKNQYILLCCYLIQYNNIDMENPFMCR